MELFCAIIYLAINCTLRGFAEIKVMEEFTYAYAITTHKAQGSEWDKVVVLEEGFPFDKTEHARWLYTALTRAEEKAVIIRK